MHCLIIALIESYLQKSLKRAEVAILSVSHITQCKCKSSHRLLNFQRTLAFLVKILGTFNQIIFQILEKFPYNTAKAECSETGAIAYIAPALASVPHRQTSNTI